MNTFEKLAGTALLAANLMACTDPNPLEGLVEASDSGQADSGKVDSTPGPDAFAMHDATLHDAMATDMALAAHDALMDAVTTASDGSIVADASTSPDLTELSDAANDGAPAPDGFIAVDAATPDAAIMPPECQIPVNCARRECAEEDAISFEILAGNGTSTVFAHAGELNAYEVGTSWALSCDLYNQGFHLDVLLRDPTASTILQVRSNIEGLRTGIWVPAEGFPLEFTGAGQQPPGEPTATVVTGQVSEFDQAEVYAPYYPVVHGH